MKKLQISLGKRSILASESNQTEIDTQLKNLFRKYHSKKLNYLEICEKLIEHNVPPLSEKGWTYDEVKKQYEKLKF